MKYNSLRRLISSNPFIQVLISPFVGIKKSYIYRKRPAQKVVVNNIIEMMTSDPVLKVDDFKGKFMMDAHCDIFANLIIEKRYEPELAAYCINFVNANRDVIDVGANIGLYTVLFGKILNEGKVFAIEPTKNALKYLYRNLEMNDVKRKVEVFEGVASDINGYIELKTIRGKEEYSSLGAMKHPSIIHLEHSVEKVTSTTLDDLVVQKSINPGFLKVDVEGAEFMVFNGAKRILTEHRPIILSELSDFLLRNNGSSAREIIEMIRKFDYDVFDPLDTKAETGWKRFGDIICFPKEMHINLNS